MKVDEFVTLSSCDTAGRNRIRVFMRGIHTEVVVTDNDDDVTFLSFSSISLSS